MKVLDAGDHPLSNADVLDWVKRKRAQHSTEDAEDQSRGAQPCARPANFTRMLDRTERELSSDKYPYAKNPSAYAGTGRKTALERFALEVENVVQEALQEAWRERLRGMTREDVERTFADEQERKCLTEPEMLMVYNYAPQCVEMLQPMLENVEDRFTPEEQQMIVDVVMRVLRADEVVPMAEADTATTADHHHHQERMAE
jgi:hypothetical protein